LPKVVYKHNTLPKAQEFPLMYQTKHTGCVVKEWGWHTHPTATWRCWWVCTPGGCGSPRLTRPPL